MPDIERKWDKAVIAMAKELYGSQNPNMESRQWEAAVAKARVLLDIASRAML